MTRGGPVKRTRDVRVRLTPVEWAIWDAARAASGRREMGAWVRAVLNELLTGHQARRRPGDLPRAPAVNTAAARQLVGAAANLNQLARWCHVEGRGPEATQLHRLAGELQAAADAVRGTPPPPAGDVEDQVLVVQVADDVAVQEPTELAWRRLLRRWPR